MSKQQKEFKKRKDRERESKNKVLSRRENIRKRSKEAHQEFLMNKRIDKLQREMDRMEMTLPENVKDLPDKTLKQIEHNVKILAALEQEHEDDLKKRQELNKELDEQGHTTLDEKVQAIRKDFLEHEQIRLVPKPRKYKDVSDVEIIKAPVSESEEIIKASVSESESEEKIS